MSSSEPSGEGTAQPSRSAGPVRHFDQPPPTAIDRQARYSAEIVVSTEAVELGTIVVALDPFTAPVTVNNFVALARHHFYDGLTFHRVIKGFMCQGGCPEGTGRAGPGYTFADELPRPGRYELGSVAMANSGPNTNGSQFFIVSGPKGIRLPPQYSLFGKVIRGLDVVGRMQAVPTGPGDAPIDPVMIDSVSIVEKT